MALLSIITNVCGRLSLPQPSAVVSSTDKQVIQLLGLVNQEGKELARRCAWEALNEEASFTTVAAAAQPTALPADLDRFISGTFFNRSTRRELVGPITPREWQQLQAQPVQSRVYLSWRERTGQFLFAPPPPAGQTIAYEYVSINWVKGGAASPPVTPQSAYTADTDLSYLDEELITLGLIWRYLRAKGLDYAEEMETYERQVEIAIARDGGASMLSIAPGEPDLARINLPDGNFGV